MMMPLEIFFFSLPPDDVAAQNNLYCSPPDDVAARYHLTLASKTQHNIGRPMMLPPEIIFLACPPLSSFLTFRPMLLPPDIIYFSLLLDIISFSMSPDDVAARYNLSYLAADDVAA